MHRRTHEEFLDKFLLETRANFGGISKAIPGRVVKDFFKMKPSKIFFNIPGMLF